MRDEKAPTQPSRGNWRERLTKTGGSQVRKERAPTQPSRDKENSNLAGSRADGSWRRGEQLRTGYISRGGERRDRQSRTCEPDSHLRLLPTRRSGPVRPSVAARDTHTHDGADLCALRQELGTHTRRSGPVRPSSGARNTPTPHTRRSGPVRPSSGVRNTPTPHTRRSGPVRPSSGVRNTHLHDRARQALVEIASITEVSRSEPAEQSYLDYLLSYPLPGEL